MDEASFDWNSGSSLQYIANVQNTHIICFFPRSCSPVNVRRELFLTLLKNKLFVQTFSPKHVLHLFNVSATQGEKYAEVKNM